MKKIVGDVTENALRQAAEFDAVLQSIADALVVYNEEGRVIRFNPAAEHLFGYTQKDMQYTLRERFDRDPRYRPDGQLLPLEDIPVVRALRGETITSEVLYIIRPLGNKVWLSVSAGPVYGKDGVPVGAVATFRDVSKDHEAQQQLEKTHKYLNAVIYSITDGLIISDLKGNIIATNPAMQRLLPGGDDTDKFVIFQDYIEMYELRSPDGDAMSIDKWPLRRAMHGESFTDFEVQVVNKETGEMRPLSISGTVVNHESELPGYAVIVSRDITERKIAENTIKEERDRAQSYLDLAGVVMVALDSSGKVTLINKKGCELLGYEYQEIIGKSWFDTFLPESMAQPTKLAFRELMAGKLEQVEYFENPILNAKGEERQIAWHNALLRDKTGAIIGTLSSGEDITERLLAREARRESQMLIHATLECAPIVLYTLDPSGIFQLSTGAGLKSIGLEPGQVVGQSAFDIYKDNPEILKNIRRALKGEEVNHVAKIGNTCYDVHYSPLLGPHDEFKGVVGVALDITDRMQALKDLEEALDHLSDSEGRLSTTLSSIGDGVIATDAEGKIILINRVAQELIGIAGDEAIGKNASSVYVTHDEKTCKPRENVFQAATQVSGKGLLQYALLVRPDGSDRLISETVATIVDENGVVSGAVCAFNDVTQLRALEKEAAKSSKLESLGLLAGGLAHDFNNILAVILGGISLVQLTAKLSEQEHQLLEAAEKATERARDLTRQLITFSKGGAPVKSVTSIAELLRETAGFVTHGSKSRCQLALEEDLWSIQADSSQISQVIENLVINADQAMPEGGTILIRASNVAFDTQPAMPIKPGKYVRISITDQGVGIPANELDKIFDPFYTTKSTGTGLGLTTVHSIIKRHEGHIEVTSKTGGSKSGTTFTIYLLSAAESAAEQTKKSSVRPLPVMQGHILVMDDEPLVRQLAESGITALGCTVVTSTDGQEAINLYRKALKQGKPFDGVLLDLTVPGGMGGKQTLEFLRELNPNVRAAVFSGYSNDPIMSNYEEFGFVAAISKPFRIISLSEVIAKLLERP